MACMEHTFGYINVFSHGIEQFSYRYSTIFFSMMRQGDDGYGEMTIVVMMAIVMIIKKKQLQLVGRLGNSQCLSLVFTGLHFSLVCWLR